MLMAQSVSYRLSHQHTFKPSYHILNKQTKMKKALAILMVVLFLSACQNDNDISYSDQLEASLQQTLMDASQGKGLSFFTMPESDDYSSIPQDANNQITKEKVELGQLLYHETGLALAPMVKLHEGTFSCASCHFASAGFQANRHQGLSDGGLGFGSNGEGRFKSDDYADDEVDVQPIRTPTAMNGAYQELMLWNGQFGATGANVGTEAQWKEDTPIATNHLGYEGLEIQAIAGLGVHRLKIEKEFLETHGYIQLFDNAFPSIPETERYTTEYAGLAIAAYERTLLANESPFQRWLKGDKLAMRDLEKEGARLFFGKAQCGSCHTGPALNSMEFYGYGMKDLYECPEPTFLSGPEAVANLGRGGFTGNAAEEYKFKVPQLYNLIDSPFLGHGSSFRSVSSVVTYKNDAVAENTNVPASNLAQQFQPLSLTEKEIELITLFIERSLYDPNLDRYVPQEVLSGQCFPNNDPMAQDDLGCK